MNGADIILTLAVSAALAFAVRSVIKNRKNGCCCGDCCKCSGCNKK
ncbi:FeoB-associated Cys-rich membrane protein [Ruminococcus flavefaciens]|nr:FeoB-associated Cys-rich membrane protein [Ruminococcus flavefaciens]MDD7518133.1 FeoB-associated Cys-rich membrane protein [Ruminococcus flavefaciens]MDY5691406.1 FeoB-associated Cys-rich membrane protein [Ruminococcus flavefaciens]